jgi:hypothetical protein
LQGLSDCDDPISWADGPCDPICFPGKQTRQARLWSAKGFADQGVVKLPAAALVTRVLMVLAAPVTPGLTVDMTSRPSTTIAPVSTTQSTVTAPSSLAANFFKIIKRFMFCPHIECFTQLLANDHGWKNPSFT